MKLDDAFRFAHDNIKQLERVEDCGCYYCMQSYSVDEIYEFIDDGTTAICPHCGMDAVIPGMANKFFLQKAHDYYFGV